MRHSLGRRGEGSSSLVSSLLRYKDVFRLTAEELDCAKEAVEHHRHYSTMLPTPIEWEDLTDRWEFVRDALCDLDLEHYHPMRPIVVTAAKNDKSTRVLHLLHPHDMIIYTSLTLLLKDDIEASRVPTSGQCVYSYRASSRNNRIYSTTQDLHFNYIQRLKYKAARERAGFVGVTDIANFYPSIQQEKLHRLLVDVASTERNRTVARLLVATFARLLMTHDGKGIPTGPYASRLLAEVLLNDIDRYLVSKRVDFVRWVDDFNFFTPSFTATQRIILELSAWLYEEHDLSLQSSKTRILDARAYSGELLLGLEDLLSERTEVAALLFAGSNYDVDEDPDRDGTGDIMDDVSAMELLEMLADALMKEERTDYRVIDFAVRRLRWIHLDRRIAEELLDVLVENLAYLVPVIENIARLISHVRPRRKDRCERIARRLLRSIDEVGSIDHYAVWILTIFVQDNRWGCADELIDLFRRTRSDAVRYYAALAVSKAGQGEDLEPSGDAGKGPWSDWPC